MLTGVFWMSAFWADAFCRAQSRSREDAERETSVAILFGILKTDMDVSSDAAPCGTFVRLLRSGIFECLLDFGAVADNRP